MYKLKVSEMRKTVNKMKSRLYHKEVLKFFLYLVVKGVTVTCDAMFQDHMQITSNKDYHTQLMKVSSIHCVIFLIKYRSKSQTNLILILTTLICMKDVDYFTKYKNLEHKFLYLVIKIKKNYLRLSKRSAPLTFEAIPTRCRSLDESNEFNQTIQFKQLDN